MGYEPAAAFSSNLQGCSAYAADGHWHYVTYGLSELYLPEPGDDRTVSKWGFEFSFRLAAEGQEPAPEWPFRVLNRLANFVNEGRLAVAPPGTRINLGGPITGHPDVAAAPTTELTTFAVALDPQLGAIDTDNGRVAFLLLVGVTDAERDAMMASSTATVLETLAVGNELLVTDVRRGSS